MPRKNHYPSLCAYAAQGRLMVCLELNNGSFAIMQNQPTNISECTYVMQSGLEVSAFPPLTSAQGLQISIAIGICWAAAYAFRVLGQFFKSNETES